MPNQTDDPGNSEQEFTITRTFSASRELIWSALTDPSNLPGSGVPAAPPCRSNRSRSSRAGAVRFELTDLGDGRTELRWTTRADFDEELLENAKTGTAGAADQLGAHLASIQS